MRLDYYHSCKKKKSVIKFVNSLELFGIGYSWGGFESLTILQELARIKKMSTFKAESILDLIKMNIL